MRSPWQQSTRRPTSHPRRPTNHSRTYREQAPGTPLTLRSARSTLSPFTSPDRPFFLSNLTRYFRAASFFSHKNPPPTQRGRGRGLWVVPVFRPIVCRLDDSEPRAANHSPIATKRRRLIGQRKKDTQVKTTTFVHAPVQYDPRYQLSFPSWP